MSTVIYIKRQLLDQIIHLLKKTAPWIQREMTELQENIKQEERQSINVDRFLSIVKKYTHLTELTPEILHEFVDKILVHAPDKSSGRRLQEIEIIYNYIGVFDHSKVNLWKGKAV